MKYQDGTTMNGEFQSVVSFSRPTKSFIPFTLNFKKKSLLFDKTKFLLILKYPKDSYFPFLEFISDPKHFELLKKYKINLINN